MANCQVTCRRFASVASSQAANSRLIGSRSGIRRFRHCRAKADSSISAMSNQDPCFGVEWIANRSAGARAYAGANSSYNNPSVCVLKLSMTTTSFSAPGWSCVRRRRQCQL